MFFFTPFFQSKSEGGDGKYHHKPPGEAAIEDQAPQAVGGQMPQGKNTKTGAPKPAAKRHSDQEPEPQADQERNSPVAATGGHTTPGKQIHKGEGAAATTRTRAAARAAKAAPRGKACRSEARNTCASGKRATVKAGTPEQQEVKTEPPRTATCSNKAAAAGKQNDEPPERAPPSPKEENG